MHTHGPNYMKRSVNKLQLSYFAWNGVMRAITAIVAAECVRPLCCWGLIRSSTNTVSRCSSLTVCQERLCEYLCGWIWVCAVISVTAGRSVCLCGSRHESDCVCLQPCGCICVHRADWGTGCHICDVRILSGAWGPWKWAPALMGNWEHKPQRSLINVVCVCVCDSRWDDINLFTQL